MRDAAKILLLILALLLLQSPGRQAPGVTAQGASLPDEPEPTREFQKSDVGESGQGIRGRLLDARGNPVKGARIRLMQELTDGQHRPRCMVFPEEVLQRTPFPFRTVVTTKSDGEGLFRLGVGKPVPGDTLQVRIQHEGFCDQALPNIGIQPNAWWDAGDVRLETGVAVHGRVTTTNGLPVASATVSIDSIPAMVQVRNPPELRTQHWLEHRWWDLGFSRQGCIRRNGHGCHLRPEVIAGRKHQMR